MTEQVQQERDPVLDIEVNLTMKVEDVNALLQTLSKLPFGEVAGMINVIRNDVIAQVQAKTQAAAAEETAESGEDAAA